MATNLTKMYGIAKLARLAESPTFAGRVLTAVRDGRTRWEHDRVAEVFGETWFTDLRYDVERAGLRPELSTRDYTWLLIGSLFDGRMPASLVPRPDERAVLDATRYWLAQRAYREPRYRTAILLQRSTLPGRHQVAAAALAASNHPHPAGLLAAIRDNTVVEFVADPALAADFDPAVPDDVTRRGHMVAFAYWIRAVDAHSYRRRRRDGIATWPAVAWA